MINWPKYGLERARKDFEQLSIDNIIKPELKDEYQNLRSELIGIRDEVFDEFNFDNGIEEKYVFDLNFGLKFYEMLKINMNLDNRVASEDDIWRFLSIKIIPDIVHSRWNFNEDHFYLMSRRIWLKQIWWYIHLSWQGNLEATHDILKDNTTDTISSLVERPGLGYNVQLYREIMKQHNTNENVNRLLLRKVMVLNTAKIKSIHPNLIPGGVEEYVKNLFEVVAE